VSECVCVRMCVYVYVCVYVCICAWVYRLVDMDACVCVPSCVCSCARVHACLLLLIYEGLYRVRVCVFTNLLCVWTCVSTYTALPTNRTDCTISSLSPYTLKTSKSYDTKYLFRFTDLKALMRFYGFSFALN
jgi:hypothetical protein